MCAKGIRSFYTWAVHNGYLLTSPVGLIKPKRVHRRRPVRFEIEELVRILIAASTRHPRRGWAILACLSLGCRRAELVGLRLSDVDFDRGRVHILGKGRRHRDVEMNGPAREAITELLRWSDEDRILPIEPNTFNGWVKQAIANAGIDPVKNGRRRTPHTLRATFASILLDDGAPPQVVQELLGHESLATTSSYAAIGEQHTTRAAVMIPGERLAGRSATGIGSISKERG
jgi:site-specific recombinase XerD